MSATAEQRRYWTKLVMLGCIVCGSPAEIAHAHSGSIRERMHEPKAKGKKLQRYNWLALPLCPPHHRDTYCNGLDRNVAAWESKYGTQAEHIDKLGALFGMDLWRLAGKPELRTLSTPAGADAHLRTHR